MPGVLALTPPAGRGRLEMRDVRDESGPWYAVQAAVEDTTRIDLYGPIGGWDMDVGQFVRDIVDVKTAKLDLHINSPGGSAFDGLAIYNTLLQHPSTITSYVDGLAASAASFIAQAADKVVMAESSMMMIHQALAFCFGNASELREMIDLLDKVDGQMADLYTRAAGGKAEDWYAAMMATTWYTGAEAVKAGLADETYDPPDRDSRGDDSPQDRWDRSPWSRHGRATTVREIPAPPVVAPEPEQSWWDKAIAEFNNDMSVNFDALKEGFYS